MSILWEQFDLENDSNIYMALGLMLPIRMHIEFLGRRDPDENPELKNIWKYPYHAYKIQLQSLMDSQRTNDVDFRTGIGISKQIEPEMVWESLFVDLSTLKTTQNAKQLADDFGYELSEAKVIWSQLIKNKKKIQYGVGAKWSKIILDEHQDWTQICQNVCQKYLDAPINGKTPQYVLERKWMILSTLKSLDEQWDQEVKKIYQVLKKKEPQSDVPKAFQKLVQPYKKSLECLQEQWLEDPQGHRKNVYARLEQLELESNMERVKGVKRTKHPRL